MEGTKKQKKQVSFMKNVLMLMVAQVAIKILGFVYRLVIINIDGLEIQEMDTIQQGIRYTHYY